MNQPIPFVDFGGSGETIHFAHANGFPASSYLQFVNELLPHFHVIGMNARPLWTDSHYEDFNSWEIAANDLIHFLDEKGLKNIIGIGHSFGAICTLIAANKRPELFRKLIFIEPVILPRWFYLFSRFAPVFVIKQINPVIKKTLVRRDQWPNREAAFKQFRKSKLFSGMDDNALWDYVNSTIYDQKKGGVRLGYSKEWEAQIFLTVTNPWKDLKQLKHDFLVFRGETSDTIFPQVWKHLKAFNPKGTYVQIQNAGHLVPLEKPTEVADAIRNFVDSN